MLLVIYESVPAGIVNVTSLCYTLIIQTCCLVISDIVAKCKKDPPWHHGAWSGWIMWWAQRVISLTLCFKRHQFWLFICQANLNLWPKTWLQSSTSHVSSLPSWQYSSVRAFSALYRAFWKESPPTLFVYLKMFHIFKKPKTSWTEGSILFSCFFL